jgi:DNA-binding CsgD family transcriptional regulator
MSAQQPLVAVLGTARLRVLRATVLICLLISAVSLFGAIAGYTPSGQVTGPAILLGATWCAVWILAAAFPALTARAFTSWRQTLVVLASADTLTAGVTGGIDSPLLAVCMYAGWIASVVVLPRPALCVSLAISSSLFAGYLLAGDSVGDIFTGPYRYGAVTSVALPCATGVVGVLIASVTNSTFNRLAEILATTRAGGPAATPGLTALLAGTPLGGSPAIVGSRRLLVAGRTPLTESEQAVVRLLAEGHAPKQIALLRGVKLSTVRSQLKRAKQKTGARTLPELARYTDA